MISIAKYFKRTAYNSLRLKSYNRITYFKQPFFKSKMSFFFGKDEDKSNSKKTADMERFEKLNKDFKTYRNERKYEISPEKRKTYLTEEERKRRENELQKDIDNYLSTYKYDAKFDELKFVNLISKLSYTIDSSFITKNEKFIEALNEMAQNLLIRFRDIRSIVVFIMFCAINNITKTSIWECFNGYLINNYKKLAFQDKITVLSTLREWNQEEMQEFFEIFENEFLLNIKTSNETQIIFNTIQVLALYNQYKKGTENFIYTLEDMLLQRISDTSIDNLVTILVYYSKTENENTLLKNQILPKIEQRLSKSHVFLNNDYLISVLYSFIKMGRGDIVFYKLMQERTILQVDTFTLDQINKILTVYANKPQYSGPVFKAVENHLRKDFNKIPRYYMSSIFQIFAEFRYGSQEFLNLMENYLLSNIFSMTNEELSKNLWGFAHKKDIFPLFFKKAAECILGKVDIYNGKELASFIWSFSKVGYDDPNLYNKIEETIYSKLQDKKFSLREVTTLLWAYIQRVPLRSVTFDLMRQCIIDKIEEIQSWDLTIIFWGFSRLEGYECKSMFKKLKEKCVELVPESTIYELCNTFRVLCENELHFEDNAFYKVYMDKIEEILPDLDFDYCIILIYSVSILHRAQPDNTSSILSKLKEKAILLKQQIQEVDENKDMKNNDLNFSDVNEYLANQEIEKLKNQ